MSDDKAIARTDRLISLARVLFDEYLKQHPNRVDHQVPLDEFFSWVRFDFGMPPSSELLPDMLKEALVGYDTWEEFRDMPEHPSMYRQFEVLWEQVCLHRRGRLKHPLASVHFVALLRWEDGRMTPLSNFVPRELVNKDGEYTDGDLCTMLKHAGHVLAQLCREGGVDAFHDQQSYLVSEHTIQLMAHAIQSSLSAMQPAAAAEMKSLLDICFSYVNPPIHDPTALALIEKKRAERLERDAPDAAGTLGGGWEG